MKKFLILGLIPLLLMVPGTAFAEEIPIWVKNTAGWWANDDLSDKEFVNAVGFLIKNGIITLPTIESTDGIPSENIFFLLNNNKLPVRFEGEVIPVPVVPVYMELTSPNGEITKQDHMIGPGGKYSFVEYFSDDAEIGIYHVKIIFNNKIVMYESFKLEKAISRDTSIPIWIKNNAEWWAEGHIDDSSFISGIQHLVSNRIIIVESDDIGRSFYKPLPSQNYKETHVEGFPDPLKTPEYYLDRYYSEPDYRDWFDRQFPNSSIYEILGLISSKWENLKYVFPSEIYSKKLGITSNSISYVEPIDRTFIEYSAESKYKSKFGNVDVVINKIKDRLFAEETFVSLNYEFGNEPIYQFQDVTCTTYPSLGICLYDKYLIIIGSYLDFINQDDRKLRIVILDKIFQNISMIENLDYESRITPIPSSWQSDSMISLLNDFTYAGQVNVDGFTQESENNVEKEISNQPGFSGLFCSQDEYGIVTMRGFYTNGPDYYSSIWFTFGILDSQGRVVATGVGDVSNISPYQTKMFDASAQWSGFYSECIIEVDTAYP